MSENMKNPVNTDAEKPVAQEAPAEAQAEKQATPQDVVAQVARGKLVLDTPILSKGENVTELHYDFLALTGFEYADAMDSDATSKSDSFHLTNRQALSLFAAAAVKKTESIDREVVIRGLSISDAIKAVQIATVFFVASSRAGNRRITKE